MAEQVGVRTSLCNNLHAKCYLHENEAIITSMNLYEFSQMNNNEMGIHFTKSADPELYQAAYDEATRLLTISEEIRVTVRTVAPAGREKPVSKPAEVKAAPVRSNTKAPGFCIRTGVEIPFNVERPLSYEAYKS